MSFKNKKTRNHEFNSLKKISIYEDKIINLLRDTNNELFIEFINIVSNTDDNSNNRYVNIKKFISNRYRELININAIITEQIISELQSKIFIDDTTIINKNDETTHELFINFSDNSDNDEQDESHNVTLNINDAIDYDEKNLDLTQMSISKQFTYNICIHFIDYLKKIQGKKTCAIPEHVFKTIKDDIKKYRLHIPITKKQMMDILQRHKFTLFYDYIPYLLNAFNESTTQTLDQESETYLIQKFKEIQNIFELVCPKYRKSFINYKFTIFKILELQQTPQRIAFCENMKPLLKSRDKLIKLDIIWHKICNNLKWKYIPTL